MFRFCDAVEDMKHVVRLFSHLSASMRFSRLNLLIFDSGTAQFSFTRD